MSQHDVMAEVRRLLPDGSFDATLTGGDEPPTQRARRRFRRTSFNARVDFKTRRQTPIPEGPGAAEIGRWDLCPSWAPDVFAVAATLIELSGSYTAATCVGNDLTAHAAYLADVVAASDAWKMSNSVPQAVENWWVKVIDLGDTPIAKIGATPDLAGSLFRLVAVSDQICAGIGWSSKDPRAATSAAKRALFSFLETAADTDAPRPLPHHPRSLCERVPPDVAIVLPKALTPAVGCTVRALSHHLALLPGCSIVSPRWHQRPDAPTIAEGAHSKHHRWCLDRSQVKRYGLSSLFHDGTDKWWEEIDVSERQLPFFAIRDDLCMTVLICEDLARADPAMPVLRAVGPNLVVALLMDGPQLESRWPARYATVLADDPGSSVLTITCAGMVDRSNYMQANPRRSVGLWRHANGHMQELFLPEQHYGLLLTAPATCGS